MYFHEGRPEAAEHEQKTHIPLSGGRFHQYSSRFSSERMIQDLRTHLMESLKALNTE